MSDEAKRTVRGPAGKGPAGRAGPVLIEMGGQPAAGPDLAPPVPDTEAATAPQGRAMQHAALLAARPRSAMAGWFWGLAISLLGVVLSVAAWDFAVALLARSPVLGWAVTVLLGAFVLVLLIIALREAAAFARLGKIDKLQQAASAALGTQVPGVKEAGQDPGDLVQAGQVTDQLCALYRGRAGLDWGLARLAERRGEHLDALGLLALAEAELMVPLDKAAAREVEAATRQVALVTAMVPMAFADVVAALTSNLRMIRRIAEIYGGRAGTLGSWRLTRAVLTHLVATGAVAVGDDMISSVAGGGMLSKLSRRFGEGVVNGALTARVGLAAIEVCRPLPFIQARRPSVSGMVRRSLTGLFGSAKES